MMEEQEPQGVRKAYYRFMWGMWAWILLLMFGWPVVHLPGTVFITLWFASVLIFGVGSYLFRCKACGHPIVLANASLLTMYSSFPGKTCGKCGAVV